MRISLLENGAVEIEPFSRYISLAVLYHGKLRTLVSQPADHELHTQLQYVVLFVLIRSMIIIEKKERTILSLFCE